MASAKKASNGGGRGKDDAEQKADDLRASKDKPDPNVTKIKDADDAVKDHERRIKRLERVLARLLDGKD